MNEPRLRFEVVVVDNAPSDDRASEVAERHGARRVVEPIPGLSRARNRGARESTGDLVAYLDDDAIADSGWLGGLAADRAWNRRDAGQSADDSDPHHRAVHLRDVTRRLARELEH